MNEVSSDSLQRSISKNESLIGKHPKILEVFEMIRHLSCTNANVLIQGESGSGKGLIAKAIHHFSPRCHSPFVKVSCAVLSEGVLESELFGHERGAFTGAYIRRKGRFEVADGGTIFLDEVGEISPNIQVKLLRVLQDREFERVGGNRTFQVDIRIIAATNRDLQKEVVAGEFRSDLFYRLNVISILIPPLREHASDIPELAQYFIARNQQPEQKPKTITPEALEALTNYPWPGNVRELENVIIRTVALVLEDTIDIVHLPPEIQNKNHAANEQTNCPIIRLSNNGKTPQGLREARRCFEQQFIEMALRKFSCNISRTAREIKIARRNLQIKIQQFGINVEKLRSEISKK